MISGIHAIFYTRRAEEVRKFLRDILELPWVDAGEGWPIFAAPPTELAVHPVDNESAHELFLICDDIEGVTAKLAKRGVATTMPIQNQGWGLVTQLRLPGGDTIGLYEPKHPQPHRRKSNRKRKANAKSTARSQSKARIKTRTKSQRPKRRR